MKKIFVKNFLTCISWFLIISGSAKATNHSDTLKVGDTAPAINAFKWLKGDKLLSFEPGKIYVVEFWATWCGPCRAAMPHLSELARKYKDKVMVIGLDVWERIPKDETGMGYMTKVENFVKYIRDGMDYNVAADDSRENFIANAWLKPAGIKGIPSTFIVDQQGKIAWIGHPMSLDMVLEKVIANKYDDAARQEIKEQRKLWIDKVTSIRKELDSLVKAGDKRNAVAAADRYFEANGDKKVAVGITKLSLLEQVDLPAAKKYAEKLLKEFAPDPMGIYGFADTLIKSGNSDLRLIGLKMSEEFASRNTPDDLSSLMLLARAYSSNGKYKEAIIAQEKVVVLLKAYPVTDQNREEIGKIVMNAEALLEKYKQGKNK